MLYKILLDDNSFIIADDLCIFTIFSSFLNIKKKVSINEYLANIDKYKNWHLLDIIDNKKIKRSCTVEKLENSSIPIGSRVKLAQDIKVGDKLKGPDGKARVVNELHTGEDEMYEININNTSYTVNGGHILQLINKKTNEHLEMPVNVYMHMDKEFQDYYAMEQIVE